MQSCELLKYYNFDKLQKHTNLNNFTYILGKQRWLAKYLIVHYQQPKIVKGMYYLYRLSKECHLLTMYLGPRGVRYGY